MADFMPAHLEWLRLRGLRPSTIITRRNRLKNLTAAVGPLLDATPEILARWQSSLRLTPAAHAAYISHCQQFYRWALADGRIDADPSVRLVHPKVPQRLPRPMAEDDLALAVAAAPARIRPWLVLAAWAGLRAREIAYLDRADIRDRDDPPVLLVADGKGGKQRIVPLSPRVLAELRGLPRHGWAFPRRDGQPGPNAPWTVSQLCNNHLHGLGIDDTLHAARHRFGTRLYAAQPDLRMVGSVMGHQSPHTTAGYVAYSEAAAVEAVNRIAV